MDKQFERESITKLLIRFSVPSVIGGLIIVLYNVIDRMFIGKRLGAVAFAGVTLTFPFNIISISLGVLIGAGGCVLLAIKLGEKDISTARKIIGNQFTLFLLAALFLICVQEYYLIDLLQFMGGSGDALNYAVTYGRIFIVTMLFQFFTYGLNGNIRALGFPKYAMTTSIFGAVLNIILDYIFLYPLNMGVDGAAWATLISLALAACGNLYFFLSKKYGIQITFNHLKLSKKLVLDILKLGVSGSIIQASNSAVMIIYNKGLSVLGGDNAISAYGVFTTIHSFGVMIVQGVSVGGMLPILGYNLGAKKYDRVSKVIKITLLWGVLISLIFMFVVEVFPRGIMTIFTDSEDVITLGIQAMRYGFIALPFMIGGIVMSGVFQGLGKALLAFNTNILRKVIIIIPLAIILPKKYGLIGVWLSRPLSDLIACLIMLIFLFRIFRELSLKASNMEK